MPAPPVHGFLARALATNFRFLASTAGFHLFVGTAIVAAFALRAFLFPGIGGDDGEQLVFAQFRAGGYQIRNPPLYTWLVIVAQSVLGTGIATVLTVKFVLLWLIYVLLWAVARVMVQDPDLAALAALSPFAFYYLAWDAIHGYSHSVLVTAAYVFTLWRLLRLDAKGTAISYALLGLALGLGFLAKYAYGLFAGALLVAALADAGLRRRLCHPYTLVTAVAALLVMLPHLLWLHDWPDPLFSPAPSSERDYLPTVAAGLGHASLAFIGFLSPAWLLWLIFFPRALAPAATARVTEAGGRWRRFLGIFFLALIGLIAATIIVLGTDQVRTHYMFVLTLFPLYFFARVRAAGADDKARARYAGVVVMLAAVSIIGLIVKFAAEPLRCRGCQHHLPYADFARALNAAGFAGGTIFAHWHPHPLAGNLRARFPDARVVDAKHPTIRPPPRKEPGQCLLVWTPSSAPDSGDVNKLATIAVANANLGLALPLDMPSREIAAPLVMGRGREARLGFILLTPGRGDCH